jgi:hypothetical protein
MTSTYHRRRVEVRMSLRKTCVGVEIRLPVLIRKVHRLDDIARLDSCHDGLISPANPAISTLPLQPRPHDRAGRRRLQAVVSRGVKA